jgi:hypothetical protein
MIANSKHWLLIGGFASHRSEPPSSWMHHLRVQLVVQVALQLELEVDGSIPVRILKFAVNV